LQWIHLQPFPSLRRSQFLVSVQLDSLSADSVASNIARYQRAI
jgi:hypothetical protein